MAADAIKRKSEIVVQYSRRRRRRRALTIYYGHKSYFKLVTETNGEGWEFMSLFIARSTLDVYSSSPDRCRTERPEKLFWYIKLSDPHRDDCYNAILYTGLVRRFGDDISYTLVCFLVINIYICDVRRRNDILCYGEKRGCTFIHGPPGSCTAHI